MEMESKNDSHFQFKINSDYHGNEIYAFFIQLWLNEWSISTLRLVFHSFYGKKY